MEAKRLFYSTVTGQRVEGPELDGSYWCRNLREPVRLDLALGQLLGDGHRALVEVSPHPVLAMPLSSACAEVEGVVTHSLRRDSGGLTQLRQGLGVLHNSGYEVAWSGLFEGRGWRHVDLPTYAWQRERYWLSSGGVAEVGSAGLESSSHAFLGAMTGLAEAGGSLWTGRLSLSEHGWLSDHAVFETVLFPGAGLLDLALWVGSALGCPTVAQLTLLSPLALSLDSGVRLQVVVDSSDDGGRRSFAVYSQPEGSSGGGLGGVDRWTQHASGVLSGASEVAAASSTPLSTWPPAGASRVDVSGLYGRLADQGLGYGASFQCLVEAWRDPTGVLYGRSVLPTSLSDAADGYMIHPVLLDSALHLLGLESSSSGSSVRLPFEWSRVSLSATGARELRFRLSLSEGSEEGHQEAHLLLADPCGSLVASVGGLRLRSASVSQVRSSVPSLDRDLYRLAWRALGPVVEGAWDASLHRVVGGDGVLSSRLGVEGVEDLSQLSDSGLSLHRVLWDMTGWSGASSSDVLSRAMGAGREGLSWLQAWVGDGRWSDTELVWVTRGAVSTGADDTVPDVGLSCLWGLLRTAQKEHPGLRLRLLDVGVEGYEASLLREALLASSESELALRGGQVLAARLVGASGEGGVLSAPRGVGQWRLSVRERGSLENLELVEADCASRALAAGQVRVAVRASGMNFRDVLNVLGMYPGDPGPLGYEASGVVSEVGAGVSGLAVGDRVMGLLPASSSTEAVGDARMLTRIPAGLSFVEASTIPLVFLTAWYGLHDLGGLSRGERVLVHAGAGGVGMAAIQLARHAGAEVFATSSVGKRDVLLGLGLDASHVGSSRDLGFVESFLSATGGSGVDVVLNALAREYVEASLRLLPRGGRFLEMGKTDIRDPDQVARDYPGVCYQAFDLVEAGPDRIGQMLSSLSDLLGRGVLCPLPYSSYDLREAPSAFRFMAQARHVGKLVLQPPVLPLVVRDGSSDGRYG